MFSRGTVLSSLQSLVVTRSRERKRGLSVWARPKSGGVWHKVALLCGLLIIFIILSETDRRGCLRCLEGNDQDGAAAASKPLQERVSHHGSAERDLGRTTGSLAVK